jgi:cell division protein FtsQ
MTTLHIRQDQLRGAVSTYPIVKDLRVSRDLPHGLRIRVIQYDPVAAVVTGGRRVPVAADGTVLPDTTASAVLPTMSVPAASAGRRLADPHALRAVSLMGFAPRALRPLVQDVRNGPGGLEVQMRSGPLLEFGSATDLQQKWDAAARILADPHAAGASYLDLRIPGRPVAGRFPGDSTGGTDSAGAGSGSGGTSPPGTDGAGSATEDGSSNASGAASGDTGGAGQ